MRRPGTPTGGARRYQSWPTVPGTGTCWLGAEVVPANQSTFEDLQAILGARGAGHRCQCQRYKLAPGESFSSVEQAGADLFMFSSDYPHPEGTQDPIARFEATLDTDEQTAARFYAGNFADLYRGQVPAGA